MMKVFAMLASLECMVPILSSMIFTNVYNATADLNYPWKGTFYFGSTFLTFLGFIATLSVFISLKGKMVTPETSTDSKQPFKRLNSNLHPEDLANKKAELFCNTFRRNSHF